ncbi:MAG: ThuA domain-containing protein [Verrucomicrobiota bacterium]|jgi:type 1 glutamine amidotransferase
MKRTLVVFVALLASSLLSGRATDHKLVLIAGKPSHPPGQHEFRAGALLLQNCLTGVPGLQVNVYTNGWPDSDSAFDGANAVVIYSDGGGGHPAIQGDRAKLLQGLIEKGVGFGVMHYACEVPKDKGGPEFLSWVGGYYEDRYSCNPMWSPDYRAFPEHPVTRGLKPFAIRDEWYFNLRWRPDMKGITPILVAKPSDAVRDGPYVWPAGPYPHIQANKGRDEVMMWVANGPAGGRAFGFTGGHFHTNWGDGNFRKIVLNALVWVAGAEVPPGGVASTVTAEELKQNLDVKQK